VVGGGTPRHRHVRVEESAVVGNQLGGTADFPGADPVRWINVAHGDDLRVGMLEESIESWSPRFPPNEPSATRSAAPLPSIRPARSRRPRSQGHSLDKRLRVILQACFLLSCRRSENPRHGFLLLGGSSKFESNPSRRLLERIITTG